jgi:hypothetical protein
VDTALLLEGRARSGELLVDLATFEAAADLGTGFVEADGGGAGPRRAPAFSCVVTS